MTMSIMPMLQRAGPDTNSGMAGGAESGGTPAFAELLVQQGEAVTATAGSVSDEPVAAPAREQGPGDKEAEDALPVVGLAPVPAREQADLHNVPVAGDNARPVPLAEPLLQPQSLLRPSGDAPPGDASPGEAPGDLAEPIGGEPEHGRNRMAALSAAEVSRPAGPSASANGDEGRARPDRAAGREEMLIAPRTRPDNERVARGLEPEDTPGGEHRGRGSAVSRLGSAPAPVDENSGEEAGTELRRETEEPIRRAGSWRHAGGEAALSPWHETVNRPAATVATGPGPAVEAAVPAEPRPAVEVAVTAGPRPAVEAAAVAGPRPAVEAVAAGPGPAVEVPAGPEPRQPWLQEVSWQRQPAEALAPAVPDDAAPEWLAQIEHGRRWLQAGRDEGGNKLPPQAETATPALSRLLSGEKTAPLPAVAAGRPETLENPAGAVDKAPVPLAEQPPGVQAAGGVMPTRDGITPALVERALSPERSLTLQGTPEQGARQLAQQVQVMVSQNLQEADIRLNPSELGGLRIQLKMEQGEVQVQFLASQPQARELLDQALPRLREMLQQQGITLGQSQVGSFAGQQGQGAPQQEARQQAAGDNGGQRGHQAGAEGLDGQALAEPEVSAPRLRTNGSIDFFA